VPFGAGQLQRYGGLGAALCGESVVVLQEPAQPRPTRDPPVAASRPLDGEEQPVAQALMAAFVMIGLDEFVNDVPERAFANEDQLIETGFLDRPHQAFRVGIEIGRTGRQADGFDAGR
jgi:hypothetical protein